MPDPPASAVTYLMTDIEDGGGGTCEAGPFWPRSGQRRGPGPGTRLREQQPEAMPAALARHDGSAKSNPCYERVFNRQWVQANLTGAAR